MDTEHALDYFAFLLFAFLKPFCYVMFIFLRVVRKMIVLYFIHCHVFLLLWMIIFSALCSHHYFIRRMIFLVKAALCTLCVTKYVGPDIVGKQFHNVPALFQTAVKPNFLSSIH